MLTEGIHMSGARPSTHFYINYKGWVHSLCLLLLGGYILLIFFFIDCRSYHDMQFLRLASSLLWQGERKQSFGLSTVPEFRCKY